MVVDRTAGERVIAEVGFSDALETLHPKAIYILEGEQYVVEELDYENRKAFLTRSNADYYTDSITYTKIKVLDVFDETRLKNHNFSYGDVHVFSQVVGFKKLKFFTMENVGAGELQLPQQEMHTTAFWLTVKNDVLQSLDFSNEEKIEAVAGIAYLMKQISPVILLCDVRDVGVAIEDNLIHPKAIYIMEGEQYIVEELDYENRKAFLTRSNADYYTDSITYTKIKVLDIFDETRKKNLNFSYGDVHVFSQVVGFKKLKFFTMENVGAGELQLPQQEMHTTGFWLTVKNDVLQSLDFSNEEKIEAVAGIAYLMKQISPVILLCDTRDVGVAIEDNLTKDPLHPGALKSMLRRPRPT